MASAAWKRIEKSDSYVKAKLFLKRLSGKELWLRLETDIAAAEYCDWSIDPEKLSADSIVYSLGIGDDIGFDLALMRNFGADVHAFDPTPSTATWLAQQDLPTGFNFYPWAVTGSDGTLTLYPRVKKDGSKSRVMYTLVANPAALTDGVEVPAYSIPTLMQKLDHAHIDLLKMDVEGAEYQVLKTLIESNARPKQLLVEFHHRFPSIGKSATVDIVNALRRVGYRIFAVSRTGREVSFMHLPDRSA